MARISRVRVERDLRAAQNGATTTDRGRALEDLVCYLFGKVPGISITHRNVLNTFASEEIDVALWNERRPRVLDFLPNIILVEAKNWTNPVGSAEVSWFDTKLRLRGLPIGVLVALSGITGDPANLTSARQVVATALTEQRRLIVLTGTEIESLRETDELIHLIKTKLCELAVTGTVP